MPISAAIAGSEVAMTVEFMFSMNSAAPKPRIWIPSSGGVRYPDRLTEVTIEEVKNARYLALTQQIRDYLAHAEDNELTFILHVRPGIKYSRPLKSLIDAGKIIDKPIEGLPK